MTAPKWRLVAGLLAVLVIPLVGQTPEDDSWNRVLDQERIAIEFRQQEQIASGDRKEQLKSMRVAAFREVAARLSEYMAAFIKDSKSVSAVNAFFRMGYYMEFGEWDEEALVYYNLCRSHPKLTDTRAVFGQPPMALEPQVRDRITEVTSRLNQRGSPSDHDLSILVRYSGKGGINLPGSAPPPEPFGPEEEFTVAQRMSFPGGLARARQEWRRLLEQESRLSPVFEDASITGILVFGVKGSAESTKLVGETLNSYRRELIDRYFDSGLPAPTMVVFANLVQPGQEADASVSAPSPPSFPVEPAAQQQSPVQQSVQQSPAQRGQQSLPSGTDSEAIGRVLSHQIHLRDMDGLEGYFEPLDYTLILRKNLLGPDGKVYLGTGLHELVHALIHVDYAQAPPWLNEGLAALHEEYGPDGPQDNYRLYVARAAMQAQGRWPSLAQLLDARPEWWNSEARTVMAAAARYFCMFLWRQNKMPAVYKAMRDAAPDESAQVVLSRVTGMSIEDLDAQWRRDIASRDISKLDRKWGQLREPIEGYIRNLGEFR